MVEVLVVLTVVEEVAVVRMDAFAVEARIRNGTKSVRVKVKRKKHEKRKRLLAGKGERRKWRER